jgi:PadR family transcriptional regulator, regulatory protein PadR
MAKPTDLVQGSLDLLILKTISLEPKHGWAIATRIQQVSERPSRSSRARFTQGFTALSSKAGSNLNGGPMRPGAWQSSTRSPRSCRRQFEKELASWTRLSSAINLVARKLDVRLMTNSVYVYAPCSFAAMWTLSSRPNFGSILINRWKSTSVQE